MNLTPEQQAKFLDAASALLAGEPIEFEITLGDWRETRMIDARHPHRRKPKPDPLAPPRMVPLGPEDVPPGSAFKRAQYLDSSYPWNSASGVLLDCVELHDSSRVFQVSFSELQILWLIHRPGDNDADGKPLWSKCEKETK